MILSCGICLTLLAGSAAAAEVKFVLVDPANGTSQWIMGNGDTLLQAWDNAATNNGYTYAIGGNPQYPGQLSTINGPFTGYEGWGNNGTDMTWWKTYVSDGSKLSTWNIDYSQTGVVLADHQASEFPYFAFVWGTWQTWPNPWGMGSDFTVLPSDCPPVPVANFTSNVTSGTAPLSVQFDDISTGSPTSWQWDFNNDGTVDSTEQNPIYTYESAGTYTVNLTVSNAVGSDSEVKTDCITVSEPLPTAPVAAFSATPTSGDAPLTVQFTDESTGTISSYAWDFNNDGTVDSTEQSPSYTYVSAGTYSINHTVTNAAGSDSEVKTNYITVEGTGTDGLADTAWPKFGRDLNNTGQSPNAGPETNNTVWIYTTGGGIQYSGPSIGADGTIYVGSLDKNIYALNPDGTLKWKYATTGSYISGSPTIASDGTIYLGGGLDKKIYALNPDGTLKWNYTTEKPIKGSPAIGSDGTIYFGGYDKKIYALNPDGTPKWTYTTGGNIYHSTPAIGSDGTIYIGSGDDNLYALNPDGTLKWSYITGDDIRGSASIGSDGTIYFGSLDQNLYALNPDGTLKWKYNTKDNQITSPGIGDVYIGDYYQIYASPAIGSDGTIYIGDYGGTLHALNPDGTLKWNNRIENRLDHLYASAPVIDANGNIYVGSYNNNVYALNPDGTLKWNYTTGSHVHNPLAIGSDGTLYIGSCDGKLYAFKDIAPVPPVADFAADITGGNASLTVNFTDQSTGSPTSWQWDFDNDGSVDSEEKSPSYIYESAGTYTVNLTVANAAGSDSKVKTDYIVVSTQETPDTTEPVIDSVVLFPANTTAGSTITISVNATDDTEVTEVTAGDIQLTKTDDFWQGSITAPSAIGAYSLQITAKDAASNTAETSVPYRVVQLSGGANIAVSPRSSSVAAGNTVSLSIKVKNTQNIDDTFKIRIGVDELPASYQADLSWFNWTEKVVTLKAGEEVLIPMEVHIPDGTEAGRKLFRANVNSETSAITGFDTGYLVIA